MLHHFANINVLQSACLEVSRIEHIFTVTTNFIAINLALAKITALAQVKLVAHDCHGDLAMIGQFFSCPLDPLRC